MTATRTAQPIREVQTIPALAFQVGGIEGEGRYTFFISDKPSLITKGGGSSWGWTSDKARAYALNPFWQKRFLAHCQREGLKEYGLLPCPHLVPETPRKAWH